MEHSKRADWFCKKLYGTNTPSCFESMKVKKMMRSPCRQSFQVGSLTHSHCGIFERSMAFSSLVEFTWPRFTFQTFHRHFPISLDTQRLEFYCFASKPRSSPRWQLFQSWGFPSHRSWHVDLEMQIRLGKTKLREVDGGESVKKNRFSFWSLRTCAHQDGIGQNVVHFPETHRHQDVTAVSAHFGDTHNQRTDLHLAVRQTFNDFNVSNVKRKRFTKTYTKFHINPMKNQMKCDSHNSIEITFYLFLQYICNYVSRFWP